MSIQNVLSIASSALGAQSERITLIAQNLANADSTGVNGAPYQRQIPVFQATEVDSGDGSGPALGVKLAQVLTDTAPPHVSYDPSNPLADSNGVVTTPNINPITEMVELVEATRAYQANLSTVETARSMAMRTLDLLK